MQPNRVSGIVERKCIISGTEFSRRLISRRDREPFTERNVAATNN
jgi:hypothetical protein